MTLGRKAILFHCFAGCSNEEVIAALDRQGVRSRDLFDGSSAVVADRQENRAFDSNARRLWQSATAISDSPAEGYLAQRGILRASDQLRYLERTPLGPRGAVQFLPAMLAAVTTDIGIIAVHRTFIDTASGKLAGFERPKRALGRLSCGAVRLAPPAAGRLGLAEGIESALSAMQLFGIPCWATLGNERFGLVAIPESVRELHLFIDNDPGGELADRLDGRGHAEPPACGPLGRRTRSAGDRPLTLYVDNAGKLEAAVERNAGMKRSALETVDFLRDAAAKGQVKDRVAPAPERKPPELDRSITKPFEIGI
nr:toprim domain-containing protein [Sphingomonas aracearum]